MIDFIFNENIAFKWVVLATFGLKRPFFRPKFAFFLELCIVLIVVLIYLTTIASYFMGFKGKIGRFFELCNRRKFRE